MQKVLDFLEQYVQWVAIALAAAFLGFAAYSYLPGVTQPVSLAVNGETLSPGQVDPTIRAAADQLASRMQNVTVPKLPVPPFVQQLRAELANAGARPAPLPAYAVSHKPIVYPPDFDPNKPVQVDQGGGTKVAALPTLPEPEYPVPATTGFAQVTVPAAPGAAGVPPGFSPVPPAGGAPAAANVQATDTTWVRVPFAIPMARLGGAFSAARVPGTSMNTTFLRAELIRQRQMPGGLWGPEEVVKTLPFLVYPPMPGEGPDKLQAQQGFVQWAQPNQAQIMQPEFFTVLAGSDPRFTQPAADATTPTATTFDPETYTGPLDALSPEQRKLVMEARQRKQKEKDQAKPPPTQGGGGTGLTPGRGGGGGGKGGGGGRGGGGGGGGGRYEPPTPSPEPTPGSTPGGAEAPYAMLDLRPMLQVRGGPPGGPPPYPTYPGQTLPGGPPMGPGGPMMPGGMAGSAAAPTLIPFTTVPAAPFNPNAVGQATPMLDCWAYDVTANADATYRYRVRYSVQNPIWGVQNVATDPALAQVFALTSGNADGANAAWTPPITIAPLTHIFLAADPTPGSTTVRFTVFRWQAGKRQRTTATVAPGDSVGKVDPKDAVDYRTNWTFVEVRRDTPGGPAYAVLMNADGTIRRQDYETDNASPERKHLDAEVDGGFVAPPPTAPGAPPGGPPPGRPPGGRPGNVGAAGGGIEGPGRP